VSDVLRGAKVSLRPYRCGFSEPELRMLYAWSRDRELLSLSGGTPLDMSFERFRELFIAQLPRRNADGEQLYAVLDEAGDLIGRAGLFAIDRRTGKAELGIVLGDRSRWGLGYGREAVRLLARHALNELGLERVVLYTYPDNERAKRSFEAVGFRPVRRVERFSLETGTRDELEMEYTVPRGETVHSGRG